MMSRERIQTLMNGKSTVGSLLVIVLLALATTSVRANDPPAQVERYQAGGVFGAIDVAPPTVTITAGARFQELTDESQQEFCQIALDGYRVPDTTITRVRIVGDDGQVIVSCGS
jgi:hypothetical protein